MESLFERYVVDGGIMMVGLIPCLILMIAFGIQSFLNLRRSRVAPDDFVDRLRDAREEGGLEKARELLSDEGHSLAEIIRQVDTHLEFNPDADAAEVLREQIESECDLLIQQNSQLAIIFRVAPQMGLLGTVFGMIQTFNEFASSMKPDVQQLSVGINVALITTAWGLSIAIPAYLVHYLIQRRISAYEQITLPGLGANALHALFDRPLGGGGGASFSART